MNVFTVPRDTELTPQNIAEFIKEHKRLNESFDKLEKYYAGEHEILNREKRSVLANNKLVCNHAKYISDTAVGYFAGNPIKYESKQDISPLLDILKSADSDTQDIDLAQKGSIFGVSYEFIYADHDGKPQLYSPDPRNAFVVYDDTVEQKPLLGVYYFRVRDSITRQDKGFSVYAADSGRVRQFMTDTGYSVIGDVSEVPHVFGGVPIIEIYNNSRCTGDFEPVLSLIDAYNILQSDRLNDKQQFVEAILLLKGTVLGDDNAETSKAYRAIRENGLLEIDADSSAEWLVRQFDEQSVEVLRKSVEQDIHKFSSVPCMSDECFGGNASGVAMRYKLLGFEQLTKIKERYFREGIKERLRLLCNYCGITKLGSIDPAEISIQFTRALPVNELEKAQMASELRDMVPLKTLLGQIPFIDDPEKAAEEIEHKQRLEREQMGISIPEGYLNEQ